MKKLRKLSLTLALLIAVVLSLPAVGNVFAAVTQDVTVNATPAFVTISNAPTTFDFGTVTTNSHNVTGNAHFTITNGSTVRVDVNIQCDNWTSTGTNWTYGNPGADTGNFDASSDDGGSGGSTGEGDYDISVVAYADTLICDNVSTVTDPTWELQLDAPSSFTHGDAQKNTVTVSAVAE